MKLFDYIVIVLSSVLIGYAVIQYFRHTKNGESILPPIAIQLEWESWGELCDHLPKTSFSKNVFIRSDGSFSDLKQYEQDKRALLIHTADGCCLAQEGAWIIIDGIKVTVKNEIDNENFRIRK